MKNSFTKQQKYISIASIVFLIIIWKLLSLYYKSDFILPSPEKTLVTVCQLLVAPDFLKIVGITLLRGIIGFAIAAVIGIASGIFAGLSPNFHAFLNPIIVITRSTPVIAITLLALIWFSPNMMPIFIGLLTMFPIICINVMDGMKSVDPNLTNMAQFYKVKRKRIIRDIYLPAITPFVISGISTAVGIGWRAIIVGEVLSQPKYGIGTQMQSAQSFLRVDVLIAWTFVAILISYFFELLIRHSEHRIVKWKTV